MTDFFFFLVTQFFVLEMRGGFAKPKSLNFSDMVSSSESSARPPRKERGEKRKLGPVNDRVGRHAQLEAPSGRFTENSDGVEDLSTFMRNVVPLPPSKPDIRSATASPVPPPPAAALVSPNISASPIPHQQHQQGNDLWSLSELGDEAFAENVLDNDGVPVATQRAPLKRGRGRPKGTLNKRRGADEFVDVEVSNGVVGPLEQHRIELAYIPPDVLNYQPLLDRQDRTNPRPKRVRVLPLAHWKGEKPIYVVRTREDNVPEVAGYGSVKAETLVDPKQKKAKKTKENKDN